MSDSTSAGSDRQSRMRAIELQRQLSVLIERWEKNPKKLSKPVWNITRTTLADYMPWAESLFEEDHPIVTIIRYLGSVGNYDQSQFPEERGLTRDEALECLLLLRVAVQSWLDADGGGGSWQIPEIKPIRHHQLSFTSPKNKRKLVDFSW